ncbi:MAG: hypothetical protein H7Y32_10715 [Chloroflexales bacterium]|nr:hypothetical protein [Chloroflexales bacterium]
MPSLLEQPVPHVLARLQSAAPRLMIALAGLPGAGKSTLAAHLAEAVNAATAPNTLVALGMDGFHLTKDALRQLPNPAEAFARRGAPWTFDTDALLQRLQRVRAAAGRAAVLWPDFQHDIGDPVEGAFAVPPAARVVLVEGLYLLHDAAGWQPISQLFDERWYLDTPLDLALERLAQRHMRAWGYTRSEAEGRIAASDRLNAELVLQTREQADWWLA